MSSGISSLLSTTGAAFLLPHGCRGAAALQLTLKMLEIQRCSPFSLAIGPGRSVQLQHKPTRTRIPLPHSPPAQVVEKSLPAGGVGIGQLLPHPIKLPLHHLESQEETLRAAPLGCTHSAPLSDPWHWMLAVPRLPGAALPLAFPEGPLPPYSSPSVVPLLSLSLAGSLPRLSPGMPACFLFPSFGLPSLPPSLFSELPSSSVHSPAADQVRAVQGSCSALCSCHHPTSINSFSPALKGKYYYSKHVTRQNKHMLMLSLSEGPTLCFLLSVSARVFFSPSSPCPPPAALRGSPWPCSWLHGAYWLPEVHSAPPGHPNAASVLQALLHTRGCSSVLSPYDIFPLS